MNRLFFNAYNNSSEGLNKVIHGLKENYNIQAKKIKKVNSKYKEMPGDVVIPWGVNKEQSGKLYQYKKFYEADVPMAEYSVNKAQAIQWINEGHKIMCRTLNNSSGGKGIVVARTVEELVDAPVYVKYKPKVREFRVHMYGISVYVVEKKRRKGVEIKEKLVRSHDNGYVFCRNFVCTDADWVAIISAADHACHSLGLKFGAVDIGLSKDGSVCIYEVNTAPGLDDTTAKWYAEQIAKEMI